VSDGEGKSEATRTSASMASAPAASAPGSSGRKLLYALALMVGVAATGVYIYDAERNLRTRQTLDRTCRRLGDELDHGRLSMPALEQVYRDDAALVAAAARRNLDAQCGETRARLTWWRWNVGMRYALPQPASERARVAASIDRAEAYCPDLMAQFVRELPGRRHRTPADADAAVREACLPLVAGMRELAVAPTEAYVAWDWASRLVAVLGTVRGERPGDAAR
jgi:hypothetical protein